jgi:hypothetical protein
MPTVRLGETRLSDPRTRSFPRSAWQCDVRRDRVRRCRHVGQIGEERRSQVARECPDVTVLTEGAIKFEVQHLPRVRCAHAKKNLPTIAA